jgi:hypothetical protein
VRIIDESLVSATSELASPVVGGLISKDGLQQFVYDSTETNQGYYYVENLNDWYSRLTNFYNTNLPGFSGTNGVTLAARDLATNGVTGWTDEWYHVYSYLQYGGPCYVSWQSAGNSGDFKYLDIDVVFQGGTASAYQSLVSSVVNERSATDRPVFGVFSVPSTTAISASMTTPTVSDGDVSCVVFGEKRVFNTAGSATNLITVSLAPDVAGCIARTDRDTYPWYSPAGPRRGRINNAVQLAKTLTEADKQNLYTSKINPVFNVPGEGILLYGDKTLAASSSTLTSINVARLFIYLKKTLAPLARGVLFEQNDAITRSSFVAAADSVLRQVQAGRGVSEYKIICDDTNNTPAVIAGKNFVADILVKPIPAINFVRLTLTNKNLTATL